MGKRMQTTATMRLVQLLLTFFTLVFMIMGLTMLVIGLWGVIELKMYLALSTSDYSQVPYVLIGTGVFMFASGIIGLCATWRNYAWLLQVFGVLTFMVFVSLLSAGICGFLYRSPLQESFRNGLESAIDDYTDRTEQDHYLDKLQSRLECCGTDNYTDWFEDGTNWSDSHGNSTLPWSCCNEDVHRELCEKRAKDHKPIRVDAANKTMYAEGCYSKVNKFLASNFAVIGGSALGFAFFQGFGVFLTCCLARMINMNKYEMV
ncbi:tetraspanin-7-like [Anneissia japonica]|uniref:tetraspanin-7-like n=1 Tax=Anneissia japonica TaxID=1529436 RepID=UPI0014259AAB|nr:tetraspanin-7-like [Anneissia japonica]